jgi:hypothetical protein
MQLGDKLPKISLRDNEGNPVDVAGLAGAKGVVIFLYPKVSKGFSRLRGGSIGGAVDGREMMISGGRGC